LVCAILTGSMDYQIEEASSNSQEHQTSGKNLNKEIFTQDKIDEIHQLFEREYTAFVQTECKFWEEKLLSLNNGSVFSKKVINEKLEELRQKPERLHFNEKVDELNANFFSWWPGGSKRKREEIYPDLQGMELKPRELELIEKLDSLLEERGYRGYDQLILTTTKEGLTQEELEIRSLILADAYVEMKKLEFERSELVG
jgi:hypothetical protein